VRRAQRALFSHGSGADRYDLRVSSSPAVSAAPDAPTPRRRRLRAVILVALAVVVLVTAWLFLAPAGVAAPQAARNPAGSFEDATARVAAIQAAEAADPTVREDCRTRLYDHGAASEQVIILFHGYTNCPRQYDVLAPELADLGYTVYVPRVPHHGQREDLPRPLDTLTAAEIVHYADDAVDIADGLGDRVVALGLSGGGTVTSYLAQFREDVDLAIPIAAFLGLPSVPEPLTPALINSLSLAPSMDAYEAPPDAADRGQFPHGESDTGTHAAVAYMRVGQTVFAAAANEAPKAGRVVVVVNDADDIVNNPMIESLQARWAATAPDRVELVHLPASLGLLHDLMTPDRAGQRVDVVYPMLLDLLGKG
jgi:pimeloyl-ACP methyl ester carboxylesterase